MGKTPKFFQAARQLSNSRGVKYKFTMKTDEDSYIHMESLISWVSELPTELTYAGLRLGE